MKTFKIEQKVVRIEDYGFTVSKILKDDICVIEKIHSRTVYTLGQEALTVKVIKSPEPTRIGTIDNVYSKFFKPYRQKIIKRKPNGTKL